MKPHDTPFGAPTPQPDPEPHAPSGLHDLLDERLRFEAMLARLSATFIHVPAEEIDSQIERGLQQIVDFLNIERGSLGQFSVDRSELIVTHSYARPGWTRFPRVDLAALLPWYTARLRRGEMLRFSRLPEELPPEAVHERELIVRDGGPRAHLVLPFTVGSTVLGAIGFASYRSEREWPDQLVQSLQLVGQVFANALARQRADLVLRESETRFRVMADTAPVMVWMSGTDKLCTYFNKPWLDFTGRPLHSELGNGWSEGVHPDDLERCLDTYVRAFEVRQPFRMEYRLRRCDGEYRWVLDTGEPRFDADGSFEGYVGSCIDITDHKRVEEALRESEAGLRVLLESTNAIPWVADAQSWRISYVGPQATRLLGYPVAAWFADNFWADHIHPEDREAAIAFCLEHTSRHSDFELDYRMIAADGRSVWIHDVVSVVAENGVPKTLRGFLIDVTARRQAAQDARTLNDELARVGRVTLMGELVASIAHEVNQPLCAIVGNSQAIQRMLAGGIFSLDEVREALRDIVDDGQRASAVIARMRGLLQKSPAERAAVNVLDLIREMAGLMHLELARRGIAVCLELPAALPPVLGDRVQLQQVVLNLMANAAEAMDRAAPVSAHGSDPHVPRELVIRAGDDGQGNVTVAVVDAGDGIEPAHREQIFDPFFTTKPNGTGMGLTICKRIVETHGGRIRATANADGGATFQFTLPLMREERV